MIPIEIIKAESDSVNDDFVTLVAIHKKEGDKISPEDVVGEYETSKALIDVHCTKEGFIHWIQGEGDDIKLGDPVFEVYEAPLNSSEPKVSTSKIKPIVSEGTEAKPLQQIESNDRIISNKALELLENQHIDLDKIPSRIVTTAILKEVIGSENMDRTNVSLEGVARETFEFTGLSKAKKNEIKFLSDVNSTGLVSRIGVSIPFTRKSLDICQHFITSTPLPTIVFESARLLRKYPGLNSHINKNKVSNPEDIHIGVAFDNGKNGLKVAVIRQADRKSLIQIEEEIGDLSLKYENEKLAIAEIEGSTFTITDLYKLDVHGFSPVS